MNLPVSTLRSVYTEHVEAITNQVNQRIIQLVFTKPDLQQLPNTYDSPGSFDNYGGRVPVSDIKPDSHGPGSYSTSPYTMSITGRVYILDRRAIQDSQDLRPFKIAPNDVVVKINTNLEYEQNIKNASYILIDGTRCNVLFPPFRYGMFGQHYNITFLKQELPNG